MSLWAVENDPSIVIWYSGFKFFFCLVLQFVCKTLKHAHRSRSSRRAESRVFTLQITIPSSRTATLQMLFNRNHVCVQPIESHSRLCFLVIDVCSYVEKSSSQAGICITLPMSPIYSVCVYYSITCSRMSSCVSLVSLAQVPKCLLVLYSL